MGKRKASSLTRPVEAGIPATYAATFAEIKERIRKAQHAALRTVNRQLVGLYWDIGRIIVERQAAGGWGRSVVETLAGDLQKEFPGVGGFSVQNLWYMRQLYQEYHESPKLQPLVGEIAWSHNLIIMSRCNGETGCFAIGATTGCTIGGLEDLNAEAVQLAATIKKNFEELGV